MRSRSPALSLLPRSCQSPPYPANRHPILANRRHILPTANLSLPTATLSLNISLPQADAAVRELDARLTATQREYEEKLRFVFEQLQVQTLQ